MSEQVQLKFQLNGVSTEVDVPANTVLMDLLRDTFRLTGVRSACESGVCGACTCLVNDLPVATCSTFAFEVDRARVETIEGLATDGALSAVQQAFVECSAFQCGYCTPGMVMLTTALLRAEPAPDIETAREWVSSNICRCTGYQMILEAVMRAAGIASAGTDHAVAAR